MNGSDLLGQVLYAMDTSISVLLSDMPLSLDTPTSAVIVDTSV